MGGEEKAPATARPNPPPISPFFSPLAVHHSAKRDSVERNPLVNRKSQIVKKSARARRFFSIFASNKFLLTRNIKQPLLKLSLMKKYVCKVCGHVYDPAEGDPDNGIAPGTAFEDLPDNWSCPICGVGKEDFEPEA